MLIAPIIESIFDNLIVYKIMCWCISGGIEGRQNKFALLQLYHISVEQFPQSGIDPKGHIELVKDLPDVPEPASLSR